MINFHDRIPISLTYLWDAHCIGLVMVEGTMVTLFWCLVALGLFVGLGFATRQGLRAIADQVETEQDRMVQLSGFVDMDQVHQQAD